MLLIDLDGVIADSHDLVIRSFQNRGYDVSIEDINSWDFGNFKKKTGLSTKECIDEFHKLWETSWKKIRPVDNATIPVIKYILRTYQSEIVTANPVVNVRYWLARTELTTQYFRVSDQKTDLGHSVLIEDNPTIPLNDQVLLLRDRHWNKECTTGTRFYHSEELLPILENLAKQGTIQHRYQ